MTVLLDSTQLVLSAEASAFAAENGDAIKAYWARQLAANPRLWDGQHFMFTDARCANGRLTATGHTSSFAAFLYWRDHGRDAALTHITGTSLPVTADGALLAVRMADHTANPGQLYFPAGSLDRADLIDGRFDITANIRREMGEEIGLAPPLPAFDPGLVAVHDDNAWFIARRCRLGLSFEACLSHFAAHQRAAGDDEIAALVAIRTPGDAARLKPYARTLALWHFETEAGEGRR